MGIYVYVYIYIYMRTPCRHVCVCWMGDTIDGVHGYVKVIQVGLDQDRRCPVGTIRDHYLLLRPIGE